MRRILPVLVCLLLFVSGLCAGLCLDQTNSKSAHSCCQEKPGGGNSNHKPCGHAAQMQHSNAAVAVVHPAPDVVLTNAVFTAPASLAAALSPGGGERLVFPNRVSFSVLRL